MGTPVTQIHKYKELKVQERQNIDLYLISFCQGDNNAIAKLHKHWIPELYLIAFRYVKSQEEAEDVVADCFEKLLKMSNEKRHQKFIVDQIDLKSLLIVIVKNKCLDVLKTYKNRNRIIEGIKSLWTSTASNLAEQNLVTENFEKLASFLPEKERKILKLNLDGFKNQEISSQLNISEKTVSNSLSISRKKVKDLWGVFME